MLSARSPNRQKRKKRKRTKNNFYFFLSLTIYIHLLYLLAFCICKKTNGHKSSKHFRSLDSSSLSKKHTGSVYWSKIHSAAVQQTQTCSQNVQWWEEQGVLHSPDSNIIWEEVQGQHTEKLQTTSLQSALKRCTSFKIHYSPIANVKSKYSCSMLVQKASNTAWRAFFSFLQYATHYSQKRWTQNTQIKITCLTDLFTARKS